jgi:16S rRNA (guanine527-N7)-methyltransferase
VFAELLRQRIDSSVVLNNSQLNQLESHYHLLCRWNRVLNLTSIDDEELVVERHYCESIFLANHIPPGGLRIADLGSGAGFPGIPLAIVRPDCAVTLVESHQRKSVFLREATRGLKNVKVLARRADQISEEFDWTVSRAVQFGEIDAVAVRLASRVAILAGKNLPPENRFTWNTRIQLPWGRQRFLWIGNARST